MAASSGSTRSKRKPDKRRATGGVDGITALIQAVGLSHAQAEPEKQ
jgi:hypothetical protein